jgi:hypothetical protein
MKIKILPSALEDLRRGWRFYDGQQEGLGDYLQDSLFSDIESLNLYPGIHRVVYGYHRLLSISFSISARFGNVAGESPEVRPLFRARGGDSSNRSSENRTGGGGSQSV